MINDMHKPSIFPAIEPGLIRTIIAAGLAADGEFDGHLFRMGVGCHNGGGSVVAASLGGGQLGGGLGDALGERLNAHGLADDAGGGGQHVVGADAQLLGDDLAGLLGQLNAVGGAGISVAAVDHDSLGVAVLQMLAIHRDGRTVDLVGGVAAGTGAADVRLDKCQVQLGMVMPEDEEPLQDTETTESTEVTAVPETEAAQIEEQATEAAANTEEPVTADETENPESEMTDTEVATEVSSEANEENNTAVNAAPYTLVVNRGDVCRIVCENLQANGVVDDAEAFRKFLGQKGFASSISVGSYSIPYGLDYEEIYQILKLGPQ